MTAHIDVTRSRSLRSAGVLYDVTVDGEAVGRLKRGQTISHEVGPGTHDVKVRFAKTGWQVPDPKTSPTMTYTVQNNETLVLNVSLGPANNPGMTAPSEALTGCASRQRAKAAEIETHSVRRPQSFGRFSRLSCWRLRGEPCRSSRLGRAHRQPGRHRCRSHRPRVPALPTLSTTSITNHQIGEIAAPSGDAAERTWCGSLVHRPITVGVVPGPRQSRESIGLTWGFGVGDTR